MSTRQQYEMKFIAHTGAQYTLHVQLISRILKVMELRAWDGRYRCQIWNSGTRCGGLAVVRMQSVREQELRGVRVP